MMTCCMSDSSSGTAYDVWRGSRIQCTRAHSTTQSEEGGLGIWSGSCTTGHAYNNKWWRELVEPVLVGAVGYLSSCVGLFHGASALTLVCDGVRDRVRVRVRVRVTLILHTHL